ncbi:MAG: hypothetical protein JWP97_4637 [Labilithrix sp.]|nr:hypothetical protein [Labilithrix sp.]
METLSELKRRKYTAFVMYAMASEDATLEPGAPSLVAPAVFQPRRSDVAPYGTVEEAYELVDAALMALEDLPPSPALHDALNGVLTWLDAIDTRFVLYQLEPPDLAGRGIADINADPERPEA